MGYNFSIKYVSKDRIKRKMERKLWGDNVGLKKPGSRGSTSILSRISKKINPLERTS